MYLLYIDESDTTDKELGKLTPRWYCISGMNVVASSYGKTQREWEEFIKDQKLPDDFELKGEELYQGTGCWKGKAPQERIDFCKKVCEFINNSNVKIYSSLEVVKNNDHAESYKRLLDDILTKVLVTFRKQI